MLDEGRPEVGGLSCATFCATFVALVAHISNVPHFVAQANGILVFPKALKAPIFLSMNHPISG